MHESGENYLETILMIKEKKGVVRSIDVARALNFSKPSVSRAMGPVSYTHLPTYPLAPFLLPLRQAGPR